MSTVHWCAWALLSAVGVATIVLGDEAAPRLFAFSRTHGPSAVEAAGVAALLLGWATLLAGVWRGRARLARMSRWAAGAGLASLVAGAALCAWSVAGDHGSWWVLGVGMMAAPQLAAAVVATRIR